MIELDIRNFGNTYAHLNGKQKMSIRKIDLLLEMVLAGNRNLYRTYKQYGFHRAVTMFSIAMGCIENYNNYLRFSDSFWRLNSAERGNNTYYVAQALTCYFAKHILDNIWVRDIDKVNDLIITKNPVLTPKTNIGNSSRNAKKPDFIGIDAKNNFHVFESKGNSSHNTFTNEEMQHAINQTSVINQINGHQPITKVACMFNLKDNFNGIIIDPEDVSKSSINIEVDKEKFILNNYDFVKSFLSTYTLDNVTNLGIPVYSRLLDDNYYLGIYSPIYDALNGEFETFNSKFQDYKTLYSELDTQISEDISFSKDGFVLYKRDSRTRR